MGALLEALWGHMKTNMKQFENSDTRISLRTQRRRHSFCSRSSGRSQSRGGVIKLGL